MVSPLLRFTITALALGGCGGVATQRTSADAGSSNTGTTNGNAGGGAAGSLDAGPTSRDAGGGADGDAAAPGRTPIQHRSSGSSCTPSRLPPEPQIQAADVSPSASIECHVHADCIARSDGRCVFYPANPPVDPGGTRCVYECVSDSDCPGSACTCGATVSTCLPGNCRIDDDCGSGGFCSPSLDACNIGPIGYFCHTTADTCLDDRDCNQAEKCLFDSVDSKRWACSPVGCM